MTHYSRLSSVVVDVPADAHDAEIAFWQSALGVSLRALTQFPEFHGAELSAGGIGLLTQRLGHGSPRVHLDIHTTDRPAEVGRLESLGATVVHDGEHWTTMRDPAGLVFCVVSDVNLTESTAHRW